MPSPATQTWKTFVQPLNHFGSSPGSFAQRFCVYDRYFRSANTNTATNGSTAAPIFFYTGNESPIEPYVNNTGLMWNLGAKMAALIVFAEHRFEGQSQPTMDGVADCVVSM